MAGTHEMKYTLVPNSKGKSDLWKYFNLSKKKTNGQINMDVAVCKQCNSIVKLAGGASDISMQARLQENIWALKHYIFPTNDLPHRSPKKSRKIHQKNPSKRHLTAHTLAEFKEKFPDDYFTICI